MPVRLHASAGPELTHYDVDVENAELTRRDTISLPANVHYAWPHASGRYLHVASSNSAAGIGGFVGANHSTSALRIDPANGDQSPHGAPLPSQARQMIVRLRSECRDLNLSFRCVDDELLRLVATASRRC